VGLEGSLVIGGAISNPIGERPMRLSVALVWALAMLFPCRLAGQAAIELTQIAGGAAQTDETSTAELQPGPEANQERNLQPDPQPKEVEAQPALPEAPEPQPEKAEEELKQEEHQRIMGVIPNFNSTSDRNAAPLTPKQKFQLAFRSATDPFQFLAAGFDAGLNQAEDNFQGYGQGAQGYAKRYAAAYTDSFNGTMIGNAILPILMHEDPRYFRKGTGSITRRLFYAASTTVWCKRDNGNWGPNYANVLGNFVAGGISNLYYPSSDRGAGLTIERALTDTFEGTFGAVLIEFWPDLSKRLHKKKNKDGTAEPVAN
jgi:hypothetical protein